MPNPWELNEEDKNKYINKALHANEEAMGDAKFSDLFDKNSNVYKDPVEEIPKEKPVAVERPTIDDEGYPIIQNVHTYKEDLAGIINSDKLSLSRIAMMQEDAARKTDTPSREEKANKKSIIFYIISASLVLISVGMIGGIYVLTNKQKQESLPVIVPKEKYILFAEKNSQLDITKSTKTETKNDITSMINSFKEEDSITEIIPTIVDGDNTYKANLSTLLGTTGNRVPDELLRTLSPKFFLGLYSKKGNTSPFLLAFTNSYDIAYPALLDWEGFMRDDLTWIFDTSAKTASGTPILLTFKDRVVANTDARSFEDIDGRVAFFYTFLNPNTILFARNTDTVKKVQDRLREAKFQ